MNTHTNAATKNRNNIVTFAVNVVDAVAKKRYRRYKKSITKPKLPCFGKPEPKEKAAHGKYVRDEAA